ncbi:Glucosamine-6-phosphate deaminase [Pseudoalteromonas holothuriae]|uniref:6-phosphogluconolactonase n=1 Tax=Pseudoalteromonas holothuriae TaxID=2963714 RepID=A0A9W4QX91_9GAMM|nr:MULTISPECIES: 6-phosphogluconolactonase [unclassified Pseudoalteromonas]CAH9054711.1 Glucosamine-6-phosphate deaminase [Pseudoalteromonas sp. CIP111951]CAH9057400.1 Glucosamine-6-phosphate deaminase [Pseudoalteromonas sp. CIP111854]
MAHLTERFFDSKEELTSALSALLESSLVAGIEQKGKAVLMVSGGSSPAPAYRHLSGLSLDWNKVSVAMVDERWVDASHEKSNEAFINETLLQNHASKAHFVTMKNSATTAQAGQTECEVQYQSLGKADVTILGMGPDGHTASLFPHADGLEKALTTTDIVCAINAKQSEVTGSITERMTLTLNGVANAKQVVLLISGEEKRAMYELAKQPGSEFDIPLRAVINHSDIDLMVFWCP